MFRSVRTAFRSPLIWSFLAVVISVVALVVAVVSLGRSGGTIVQAVPTSTPAPAASTSQPVPPLTETTVEPSETPLGTDNPTPPTDSTDTVITELPTAAGASYTLVKENVRVRLPGGSSRYLDLDQPLVNADSSQLDVSYQPGYTPPYLSFSSTKVAEAKSENVTPEECAADIQLAPADTRVEMSQDLVICAVTNGIGAVNEPARTKMARIVVNSVTKDDSLNLTITTWEIPS